MAAGFKLDSFPVDFLGLKFQEDDNYDEKSIESEALRRKLIDEFMNYRDYNSRINADFVLALENTDDTGRLADSIASNMPLKLSDKQKILNIEITVVI